MAIDFSKLLKKGKGVPPPMMEPDGQPDTGDVTTPPAGLQALMAGAAPPPPTGRNVPPPPPTLSAPPARKAKPAKRGKRGY